MNRAFSPRDHGRFHTRRDAPGWFESGLQPSDHRRFHTWRDAPGRYGSGLQASGLSSVPHLARCARLVWIGPSGLGAFVGSAPGAMRQAGMDRAFNPRDFRRFRTWRDAPGWYGSGLQPSGLSSVPHPARCARPAWIGPSALGPPSVPHPARCARPAWIGPSALGTTVGSTPGAMRPAGMDRAFSPRTIVGSTPGAIHQAGMDRAFSPRDYRRFRTWRDAPGWYGSGLQPSDHRRFHTRRDAPGWFESGLQPSANGSDDRSTFEERTHRSAKGANHISPGRSPGRCRRKRKTRAVSPFHSCYADFALPVGKGSTTSINS